MKLIYDNGVQGSSSTKEDWKLAFSLDPYEALEFTEVKSVSQKYTTSYKL